jgi:hypothetical protein
MGSRFQVHGSRLKKANSSAELGTTSAEGEKDLRPIDVRRSILLQRTFLRILPLKSKDNQSLFQKPKLDQYITPLLQPGTVNPTQTSEVSCQMSALSLAELTHNYLIFITIYD